MPGGALSSVESLPSGSNGSRARARTSVPTHAGTRAGTSIGTLEAWSIAYLGLPAVLFLVGWFRPQYGYPAGLMLLIGLALVARRTGRAAAPVAIGRSAAALVVIVAVAWTLLGGMGHFFYANPDWLAREAVLHDLVVKSWPVVYENVEGRDLVMRAPIGFYLPAAAVGKLIGLRVAELTMLAWTVFGVALTFLLLQRGCASTRVLAIRIAVFVVFSGMDILGTMAHYNPHGLGDHLEWWAYFLQYSSNTTQLFWVPNHALPGWIVTAWVIGCFDRRAVDIGAAIVLVALTPLWSPLTAVGLAPLVGVAVLRGWSARSTSAWVQELLAPRVVVCVAICAFLVYPYLTLSPAAVTWHWSWTLRWVGEDFVPRYIEFIVFEFVLVAALLLSRRPRDVLLHTAIVLLLLMPLYQIGRANDLAMRGSIPALALLAIRLGTWLSSPRTTLSDVQLRVAALVLVAIGAVTPLMEVSRALMEPAGRMDTSQDLLEAMGGEIGAPHYVTPRDQPWLNRYFGP